MKKTTLINVEGQKRIADLKLSAENVLRKQGIFKMSQKEASAKDLCIVCGEPALAKCATDAGVKEYYISTICEVCFDKMFQEESCDK